MADKPFGALTVTFGKSGLEPDQKHLEVYLADGLNVLSNGQPREKFYAGDKIYLGVITTYTNIFARSSAGRITQVPGHYYKKKIERFTLINQESVSFSSPPDYVIEKAWIGGYGGDDGVVTDTGILFSEPVTGVFEVKYRARARVYSLVVDAIPDSWGVEPETEYTWENGEKEAVDPEPTAFPVLVYLYSDPDEGDGQASITVDVWREEGDAEWEEWDLQIVRDCTGDPESGANVLVLGKQYVTGADGTIKLGKLAPGGKVRADISTEDWSGSYEFTVPEPEDEE